MIYNRIEMLVGKNNLLKLNNTNVTIIGLGAVGYTACEALLRSGVINLRIVDFDTIEPSNINRQLLAFNSTIGKKKTQVAKERLLDINPDANIEVLDLFFDSGTTDVVLKSPIDFVVDAIDSLSPKFNLIVELIHRNIPFISSMGAARRLDPFAIKYGDISEVTTCPVAKILRKRLRQQHIDSRVPCVYSTEPPQPCNPMQDDAARVNSDIVNKKTPLGSFAPITNIFGNAIAACVINKILSF